MNLLDMCTHPGDEIAEVQEYGSPFPEQLCTQCGSEWCQLEHRPARGRA